MRRMTRVMAVYDTPRGEELSERLSSVLEIVYLIFNEGYTAARGENWLRPSSAIRRFASATCSPPSRRASQKRMGCSP